MLVWSIGLLVVALLAVVISALLSYDDTTSGDLSQARKHQLAASNLSDHRLAVPQPADIPGPASSAWYVGSFNGYGDYEPVSPAAIELCNIYPAGKLVTIGVDGTYALLSYRRAPGVNAAECPDGAALIR